MRPHTSTRAFTLIEMMIVIGIIGLLISINAALISVHKQGYKVGEKNNIRQLGNAWLKYSQIHREKIAPAWLSPNTQSKWKPSSSTRWHTILRRPPTARINPTWPVRGHGDCFRTWRMICAS